MEKFEKLGLCENVLKVISAKKFSEPTEIQEKTIPLILEGKDVIAGSATGSGKTLAFGAGVIKNSEKGGKIQSLILTPTRELAEQVAGAIEEFSYHKGLEVCSVYGGVSITNQIKRLAYADIVVATPGRLLDHMQRNSIDLSRIKVLVLDEADRMWDMGFKEDVAKIVRACPKDRQTLLFSATIGGDLADFSEKYMKSPVEVSAKNYVDTSKLKQIYYDVQDGGKFSLLVHLLKHDSARLVMIFCNTRRNADFVAKNLEKNNINAQVIHGGMEQNKRIRVLKGFDDEKTKILVCTDVAARGLDIRGVSHIYNYDLPSDAKDYIHRIGRTARAGAEGIAVNILASRDYDNFSNIQRHNPELKIERGMTPRFERIYVKWDAPKSRGPYKGNARGGRDNYKGPRRNAPARGNQRRFGGNASPRRNAQGFNRNTPAGRNPRRFGGNNRRFNNERTQDGERGTHRSSGRNNFSRSGRNRPSRPRRG